MLANSFLSAEELSLSLLQHRTLQRVLVMLETKELVKISIWQELKNIIKGTPAPQNGFNMFWWAAHPKECGTPGCIAGWGDYLTNGKTHFCNLNREGTSLGDLFLIGKRKIFRSTEEAAHALRTYLTTGTADWKGVF